MSSLIGGIRVQLPIGKPVGATVQTVAANQSGRAPPVVIVPAPTSLIINGRSTAPIDVRSATASDVVNAINNLALPGVAASIDSAGRLLVTGVNSISGDDNLRMILGI